MRHRQEHLFSFREARLIYFQEGLYRESAASEERRRDREPETGSVEARAERAQNQAERQSSTLRQAAEYRPSIEPNPQETTDQFAQSLRAFALQHPSNAPPEQRQALDRFHGLIRVGLGILLNPSSRGESLRMARDELQSVRNSLVTNDPLSTAVRAAVEASPQRLELVAMAYGLSQRIDARLIEMGERLQIDEFRPAREPISSESTADFQRKAFESQLRWPSQLNLPAGFGLTARDLSDASLFVYADGLPALLRTTNAATLRKIEQRASDLASRILAHSQTSVAGVLANRTDVPQHIHDLAWLLRSLQVRLQSKRGELETGSTQR